jgi:RimJ/RimL family protein N-acetyltransferase
LPANAEQETRTRLLDDRAQILSYLETDRLYAAYAIGDLEPGMCEQSTWAGAERAGELEALALLFRGIAPPALVLMGNTDDLQAILTDTLRPERAYLACRPEHLSMTHELYVWEEMTPMWRMVWQAGRFQPVSGATIHLSAAHAGQLTALYALGPGNAFDAAQIKGGAFFGVFAGDQLVAAAGTHLVSPTYGVAAVGNVFTHPDYRGRGYGTATIRATVTELLR